MYELFILERKLIAIKKAIRDNKGIYRTKCKIRYWWLKRKYNKLKRNLSKLKK